MTRPVVLALDVGGTKLSAAAVSPEGARLAVHTAATPVGRGPDAVVRALLALAAQVLGDTPPQAVGVACVGPLDPASGVILDPPNLPDLHGFPLRRRLEDALGAPVVIENDANAAAYGEWRLGSGRGVQDMVYYTVSTGIGGGAVAGGRLLRGASGNAAELGHVVVVPGGRLCGCGHRGCLEAYASGTAIAQEARRRALLRESSLTPLARQGNLTAKDVVEHLHGGDPVAQEVWAEAVAMLARGIAAAVHVLNPARVVLGGGVSRAGEALLAPLRAQLPAHLLPAHARDLSVTLSSLGDEAGLAGAALLAWETGRGGEPPTFSPD